MGKQWDSEIYNKGGIYAIRNLVNNKVYIGSTYNFAKRWNGHVALLRRGCHNNFYLQNAWNKYGEKSFSFEILENIDIS